MSESLFRISMQLYRYLAKFNDGLSLIKQWIEVYDADGPEYEAMLHHIRALDVWREAIDRLIETSETAECHGRIHPDLPIGPIVAKVHETLSDITEAVLSEKNDHLVLALANSTESDWERAREARDYDQLFNAWRKVFLDLPRRPDSYSYTLPSNPYGEGGLDPPPQYLYSPLPTPTSIRLVTMLLDFEADNDILSVSMHAVDLEDEPDYVALSYTWGKPALVYTSMQERDDPYDGSVPILCNGSLFHVGQNLHRYLRQWRRNFRFLTKGGGEGLVEPTSALWIDALCINQANDREKNKQVAMMGRIYQQCSKVVVWLGACDAFILRAFDVFKCIQRCNYEVKEEYGSMSMQEKCEVLDLPGVHSWAWICVWAFLNRAWFRRAWVAQELALAPDVQFEAGHYLSTWEEISLSVGFLVRAGFRKVIEDSVKREMHGPAWKFVGFDERGEFMVNTIERDEEDRKIHFLPGYGQAPIQLFVNYLGMLRAPSEYYISSSRMTQLFSSGRHFECQDPRDKIYAFLALSLRDEYRTGRGDARRRPLDVRYQDPVCTVYLHAAWYILLSDNNLQLVGEAEIFEELEDGADENRLAVPSWVPDWSLKSARRQGSRLQQWVSINKVEWHAANRLPWIPPEDSSLYQYYLCISGGYVDRVCEVAAETAELLTAVEVALGLPAQYQWTSDAQNPIDILGRTMLTDLWHGKCPASDHGMNLFHYFLRRTFSEELCRHCEDQDDRCYRGLESSETVSSRMIRAYSNFEQYLSDESKHLTCHDLKLEIEYFKKQIFGNYWNRTVRKVFRTERGFLGSGTLRVRPGDEVYVVAGSSVPMILRRAAQSELNAFTFVSEAYVHGIMYGEMLKEGDKKVGMRNLRLV